MASQVASPITSEKLLADLARRKDNRKCLECNKPSPTFINLTVGSFVCIECSGYLREYGFRLKGLGLSTFSSEEIKQLEASGANRRAQEVWLAKHPTPDKASPGYDKPEELRRFLVRKYRDKLWHDPSAPAKPAGMDSPSPPSLGGGSAWSPAQTTRKRVDSGTRGALATGEASHRSLLLQTHARAASASLGTAAAGVASGDGAGGESDTSTDSEEEDEGLDEQARAMRRRARIKSKIMEFYKTHNAEKVDNVDLFVEWVSYHGMAAFNKKLREKYGTDIKISKTNLKTKKDSRDKREREEKRALRRAARQAQGPSSSVMEQAQHLAALELGSASRTDRSGSTNPFDDDFAPPPALPRAADVKPNPFEQLLFL